MHSVTEYFKWLVCVKEGVTKLLNEMFGQKSLESYVDNCFRKSREKYTFMVKHLNPPMDVVLPVAKHWICVQDEVTNAYFYLLDGKNYILKCLSNRFLRIEKQGSSGNCFMKGISEDIWYPLDIEELLKTMRQVQLQHDSELCMLKPEMNDLKSTNAGLSSENTKVQSEKSVLKFKITKLKAEITELMKENRSLKSVTNNYNVCTFGMRSAP